MNVDRLEAMMQEEKCSVYFRFEDVEGNSLIKDVKLPWDTSWSKVIYEVALALEGAGYINVSDRIKVTDVQGEYIPLKDEVDATGW